MLGSKVHGKNCELTQNINGKSGFFLAKLCQFVKKKKKKKKTSIRKLSMKQAYQNCIKYKPNLFREIAKHYNIFTVNLILIVLNPSLIVYYFILSYKKLANSSC